MKNNRKLSQVFLKNKNVQKRIAKKINDSNYGIILEIGPGCGQITQYLTLSKKEYIGVEIDSNLCSFLSSKLSYLKPKIINKNFLEIQEQEILELITTKKPALLFGNIPYHISTNILFKFLELQLFQEAYFTIQKEFFEVIIAPFNSKKYSSISVLFQTFCEIHKFFWIDRLNFYPKPQVDSVFISLKKTFSPNKEILENYLNFVRKCFLKPRKILWNNLISEKFDVMRLSFIFEKNNLHRNIRAHQLKPSDIFKLFSNLS
ncbi:16S rRNA (adenine(1518)-N(6)/adenine(1519)-N(6))-dimethyltransferase RsmA [Candidatus Mycoplasma haematominutum]|uniref:Dimethyladenosine transferase n=1 Tax=Candidatus Mycoplasma haematominutum 'Birmingham 1' TaxID=1116213 RepID=G8C414_9MOLU|nr:16S rRNA (adenine(1518)-N(6)/adenine(1519)-N(6))-dimethyltransferase RsmA [Candidatus Mycoplasma haematominutum]CCE67062.1 dimethyladenosine transferase [Candidatus Mycoplasma haematominutum 'Birmingham 1']